MARLPLLAAAAGLLVLVGGCGSDASDDEADPGSGAAIVLSIDVTADEGAEPKTMMLRCDPVGGDHPQAAEACDAVTDAGKDVFEPAPADQACTEVYGGPQTAIVRGVWDGDKVEGTFSRINGCEIDRWERLGTTFFDVPLQ